MVLVCPCFVLVKVFTSCYAFLLLFFLMLSLTSWHCTSIHDPFAFFMLYLISLLTSLYFSATAADSSLPFFSAFRSSHWFNVSFDPRFFFFFTALGSPKMSLAVSVIAILKISISVTTSVSSASLSKVRKLCKSSTNHCLEGFCHLRVFSRSNLIFVGALYFYLLQKERKSHH